ncbi:hypothetical protein CGLO_03753 [Colletotrichum gloeosporioides Cg-14]|nr:hypothetical protein CGLO_03753 [Colletotrichum gloeosporioides Cg-14]
MFKRIMTMLEYNHYRLPIRRMVIEMFDKNVLRRIVFDEDSDSDDDDEDEEAEEEENGSSSGDENRTERQRSISDPSELEKDNPQPRAERSDSLSSDQTDEFAETA